MVCPCRAFTVRLHQVTPPLARSPRESRKNGSLLLLEASDPLLAPLRLVVGLLAQPVERVDAGPRREAPLPEDEVEVGREEVLVEQPDADERVLGQRAADDLHELVGVVLLPLPVEGPRRQRLGVAPDDL